MIRHNAVISNRRDFLRGTLLGGALSLTAVAAWPNLARATSPTASKRSASMATPFAFESAGTRMAGLLHMPSIPPVAAVVLCGAWTAVKEQATSVYASALPGRQNEVDRTAFGIDKRMDFRCEPATGTSHATIVRAPLFAVAAC